MLVPSGIHAKYPIPRNAESLRNPRFSRTFTSKITHSIPRRPHYFSLPDNAPRTQPSYSRARQMVAWSAILSQRQPVIFSVSLLHCSAHPRSLSLLKRSVPCLLVSQRLDRECAVSRFNHAVIVIAIAGLAFGQDAAQNAITGQLGGLMGQQTAEVLQTAVASAATDTRAATAEKTVVEPLLRESSLLI